STSKTPSYTKSVSWQHHPNDRLLPLLLLASINRLSTSTGNFSFTILPVAERVPNLFNNTSRCLSSGYHLCLQNNQKR
ncbi:hypothetical protein M4Z50_23055, partial [Escherichia coli]|nr:hypothetical protein [Escherichia coli]